MICPTYSSPSFLIFSDQVPPLLYYSHIPAIVLSLIIGLFIFLKDRKNLLNKLLFGISISFSLWAFINLITWTNNSSDLIIFVWCFFGILYSLVYILSLYFVYVYIDKKDITFIKKIVLGILFLPVVIFTPTYLNLREFDIQICGIFTEGKIFTTYYYSLGFLLFAWIFAIQIKIHISFGKI